MLEDNKIEGVSEPIFELDEEHKLILYKKSEDDKEFKILCNFMIFCHSIDTTELTEGEKHITYDFIIVSNSFNEVKHRYIQDGERLTPKYIDDKLSDLLLKVENPKIFHDYIIKDIKCFKDTKRSYFYKTARKFLNKGTVKQSSDEASKQTAKRFLYELNKMLDIEYKAYIFTIEDSDNGKRFKLGYPLDTNNKKYPCIGREYFPPNGKDKTLCIDYDLAVKQLIAYNSNNRYLEGNASMTYDKLKISIYTGLNKLDLLFKNNKSNTIQLDVFEDTNDNDSEIEPKTRKRRFLAIYKNKMENLAEKYDENITVFDEDFIEENNNNIINTDEKQDELINIHKNRNYEKYMDYMVKKLQNEGEEEENIESFKKGYNKIYKEFKEDEHKFITSMVQILMMERMRMDSIGNIDTKEILELINMTDDDFKKYLMNRYEDFYDDNKYKKYYKSKHPSRIKTKIYNKGIRAFYLFHCKVSLIPYNFSIESSKHLELINENDSYIDSCNKVDEELI